MVALAVRLRKKPTVNRGFGLALGALGGAAVLTTRLALAEPVLTELDGLRAVCNAGPNAALARAKRLEGAARVRASEVLPNPSLTLEHQRTFSGPAERETIVGLSVPLSVSGRRFLLQDAAAARREQAVAEGRATLFESALAFREAYVEAVLDRARVDVLSEQQRVLDASISTLEGLEQKGEAATYDLMRHRLQSRVHRGVLESAEARASGSLALLGAWMGTEVVLPGVGLETIAQTDPEVATDVVDPTPGLESLIARARASALEARAARRRWVPDPDVFVGYRALDVGTDTAHGIAVSLTLPLSFFDHGQGEAALADAEQALSEAAADRLRREQSAQAKGARAALARLLHGFDAVARTGGEARELAMRAQQLYAAGESSITEMLDAFRAAEEARLAVVDRVREIALTRLLVMRATGTMFDVHLDRDCLRPEQAKP